MSGVRLARAHVPGVLKRDQGRGVRGVGCLLRYVAEGSGSGARPFLRLTSSFEWRAMMLKAHGYGRRLGLSGLAKMPVTPVT